MADPKPTIVVVAPPDPLQMHTVTGSVDASRTAFVSRPRGAAAFVRRAARAFAARTLST